MPYEVFDSRVKVSFILGGYVSIIDVAVFVQKLRVILWSSASRDQIVEALDDLDTRKLSDVSASVRFPESTTYIYLDDMPWRWCFAQLVMLLNLAGRNGRINRSIRDFALLVEKMSAALRMGEGAYERTSFERKFGLVWSENAPVVRKGDSSQ